MSLLDFSTRKAKEIQAVSRLYESQDQFNQLIHPFKSTVGLQAVFYYRLFDDGQYLLLSNVPELSEYLIRTVDQDADGGGLSQNLARCLEKEYAFYWNSIPTDWFMQKNIDYGVANGISIYRRLDDSFEVHSFGTTPDNFQLPNLFLNEEKKFKDFIRTFNQQAAGLIDTVDSTTLAQYKSYSPPRAPENNAQAVEELRGLLDA